MRMAIQMYEKYNLRLFDKVHPYPRRKEWLNSAYLCTVLPWAVCGCARTKDASGRRMMDT